MGEENAIKSNRQNRGYGLITIAVFLTFICCGFSDTAKGTALPRIQADFALTELQLGFLLTANSIGYLAACSYTAVLGGKIGIKNCLVIALCIIAVSGVCICYSPGYVVLAAAFFILALGNGMLEISLNIIAARTFTKNTGAMMNLAHFFFGVGAIFSPVVSANLMVARIGHQTLGWRFMYLIVLGSALIPVLPTLIGRMDKNAQHKKETGYASIFKNKTFWLVVLILAPGIICEVGASAWLVNYMEKAYSFTSEKAALQLTLFFVCYTLSRLVMGPAIDRFGLINSLTVVTAFAGVMISIGVLCGESAAPLLVVAGAGVAPIYPTIMAVVSKLFPKEIDLVMTAITMITGVFMIFANFLLGGVIYLARLVFTRLYGDAGVGKAYAAGYLILGISCFAAFAFAMILRKRQKISGLLV